MTEPLPLTAEPERRRERYDIVLRVIDSLLADEDDWVSAMATVVCELHQAFEYYDWTGFYRVVGPEMLAVGPYQGGHGCLRIPFDRGVCGMAARTWKTQRVDDVGEIDDHIACSASTKSEIVVPVLTTTGALLAVLDVDSDTNAAFTEVDEQALESLCRDLGRRFAHCASR